MCKHSAKVAIFSKDKRLRLWQSLGDRKSYKVLKTMVSVQNLCVFCGASSGHDPIHLQAAHAFGHAMAEGGMRLIYGGARIGLMGAVADSVMQAGGHVVGIMPEQLHDIEVSHEGVSELIICQTMSSRKSEMFKRSDAFVCLPGGLGTLDEAFEALTLRQLGVHDKPLVFFNQNNYWQPCIDMIDAIITRGFAKDSHKELFGVSDTIEGVLDLVKTLPGHRFKARDKLG